MKGIFSFSFRVESDIAPTAQLIIYTILPNGEIVADTQKLEIENCFANKVGVLFKTSPLSISLFEVWKIKLCTLKDCHTVLLKFSSKGPLETVMLYPERSIGVVQADCRKHNFLNVSCFILFYHVKFRRYSIINF